ncbi:ATP-binding protein [Actinocatenispora sera]|uniref:Helix-turn-helix transcriptional regulator n=1 Tax=Actinocatenispora sera TaxID=390989 RepID=A0A810L9U6_9ACTN|nr:helix-turn-helix transcriptional regulator [Actinocatenispora sera]BCJ31655.1 helix-turn-helix transcriptional regulator [Actinocatenispora sera]
MVAQQVVSPVLVGRDEALAALLATLETAVTRGPAVVLLAGEAGIGKSRLLAEFTGSVHTRVRAVSGACAELGGDGLAYAPFVAVVRRLISDGRAGRRHELAEWFPQLGTAAPGPGGKHRLHEAVLALVETVAADQPLLLAIEDLHWADAASRELFGFLARNLVQPGVLLAATYRPADPGTARLAPLLSELARGRHTTTLRLGPLTEAQVGRQLAAILGAAPDPAAARRIHERSDGNPLFVEALARAGDRTPDSLRELLLYGPRSLPAPARRLLGTASAAGGRLEHRLLARVAELGPDDDLDTLLRDLVDRSLLVVAGDGYDFRHALIRQAVYEDLLPGERARVHARYAEALRDTASLAELATHAYAAGDAGTTLTAAYRGAVRAYRSYAYAEQQHLLDRVLRVWDRVDEPATRLGVDRVDVLTAAAEAAMLTGDYPQGIDRATEGLAAVDERAEPGRAALLLEYRGRLSIRLDGTGIEDLEHALALLPDDPDSVQRGRILGMMAMGRPLRTESSRAEFSAALRAGRRTGDPTVTVRGLLGVGAMTGEPALLAEAATLADGLDSPDLALTVPMYQAALHTRLGDQQRAVAVARDGIRRARRFGLARSRGAELARYAARGLMLAGRWAEADTVLAEALREDPPRATRLALRILAGRLALLRGEVAAADEAAAQVADIDGHDLLGLLTRHQLLCEVGVAHGELDRADRYLDRALADPALTVHYGNDSRPVLLAGALVLRARLDRGGRAAAGVAARRDRIAALDAAIEVDGPFDAAQRIMLAALLDGRGFDRAVTAWRGLEQPYELAEALYRHVRADRPADSAAHLREAAQLAERLGATPLAQRIGRLVDAAPARHGLTDRERDVLELLAAGHSNRQIAQRLHISPSTAGVHVSHILAKLGAATRTEAAAIAHRESLLEPTDGPA